jgi:hypothetical protein
MTTPNENAAPATLAELFDMLAKTQDFYSAARIAEDEARKEANRWLNQLNACQKRIDEAVAKLKSNPPNESEWGAAHRRGKEQWDLL